MNKNHNIETYQIKVNRLFKEKEKMIPYSKYIKNDYPQLSKVVPKNSILYKMKYRPEIVINQFHQTSNNFNTNINIKTTQSDNLDSYNINTKSKNELGKKYQNNDYNNNNCYTKKPFRKINYNHRINNSQKFVDNQKSQDKNNNEKLIDYLVQSRNNSNDIIATNYNNFNHNYNKRNDNHNNHSYLESKNLNNTIEVKRKKINETPIQNIYNSTNYFNINQHKNISMGLSDQNNRAYNTEGSETSMESLNNNTNINTQINFFSGKKIMNQFFGNKTKLNSNNNANNLQDITTVKMEIYRIKLFKEFFKHFKKYYKSYIKIYYYYFINIIKNIKQYQRKIITNCKTVDNYNINTNKNSFKLLNENNKNNIYIINNMKYTNIKDNNKIYNKVKQIQSINCNFNNKTVKNNNNNIISYKINNKINNINYSVYSPINSYIKNAQKTSPRVNKYLIDFSSIKRRDYNSPSPSFRIGNRTIVNRDISFGKENKNENELFRDSKELNKKYEQIQRRKRKLKSNKTSELLNNKSVENMKNIKKINISTEFNEIKKYIQEKKNKNQNLNRTVSITKNKNKIKNNNFIKIIHNEEENENNNEIKYENKQKINNKDLKDKDLNINENKFMKVNISKSLVDNCGKRINLTDNNKINNYKNLNNIYKKNIYYSKKINPVNKAYSITVKDILTKDNLIHIHINYVFLKNNKKSFKKRYNFLKETNNFSLSLLSNRKNDLKFNNKLSSIKEEEISRIYDEIDIIKNNDNKILIKFIDTIYNILIKQYIKYFLYKIKIIKSKEIEENKNPENNISIKNKTQDSFKKNSYIIYNKKKDLNRRKKK